MHKVITDTPTSQSSAPATSKMRSIKSMPTLITRFRRLPFELREMVHFFILGDCFSVKQRANATASEALIFKNKLGNDNYALERAYRRLTILASDGPDYEFHDFIMKHAAHEVNEPSDVDFLASRQLQSRSTHLNPTNLAPCLTALVIRPPHEDFHQYNEMEVYGNIEIHENICDGGYYDMPEEDPRRRRSRMRWVMDKYPNGFGRLTSHLIHAVMESGLTYANLDVVLGGNTVLQKKTKWPKGLRLNVTPIEDLKANFLKMNADRSDKKSPAQMHVWHLPFEEAIYRKLDISPRDSRGRPIRLSFGRRIEDSVEDITDFWTPLSASDKSHHDYVEMTWIADQRSRYQNIQLVTDAYWADYQRLRRRIIVRDWIAEDRGRFEV
ncbi:MAG: hypothetical protein M1828_002811 [Chrysothrix sp. TS-e1954]|nr:MAG: hypothetical protein M1828_002811 [Chrysothrix sp. TS-e1954]